MKRVIFFFLLTLSSRGYGGLLLALQGQWGAFTVRPEAEEISPNFETIGSRLSLGYSARQIVDFALYSQYQSGFLGAVDLGDEDGSLVHYGLEFALRMGKTVYVGLRGGPLDYRLFRKDRSDTLEGYWKGTGGGLSIGGVLEAGKDSFVQLTFELQSGLVVEERKNPHLTLDEKQPKRRVDYLGMGLSYVLSGKTSKLIDDAVFKGFFDSFMF